MAWKQTKNRRRIKTFDKIQNSENLSTGVQLHSARFLYPAAIFGDAGVDAGFIPTTAAVAPAHDARQEDTPTGAGDSERSAGVSLWGSEGRVMPPAQKL